LKSGPDCPQDVPAGGPGAGLPDIIDWSWLVADEDKEDLTIYRVVVNHEEQYSIWPADRELPAGWNDGGKTGLKQECLAHIGEVWTDMRPLSLRKSSA
jgi:MbtH protein